MDVRIFFRTVRPYVSALAVIATAAVLVTAIYFSQIDLPWIAFLAGVLVSAILAEATRVSHLEYVSAKRLAQLGATRDRLERETHLRNLAEDALTACKPRLQLMDEVLPTMIAFFDAEGLCQYHNRAFMELLHLRPDQISGQHIRRILGSNVYQESATSVRQSLDGHEVRYERRQKMADGAVYRLQVKHVPQIDADGKVAGFFMLMSDITSPGDLPHDDTGSDARAQAMDGAKTQDAYVDSFSDQVSGHKDAALIRAAIERGSFSLYCQLITPLAAGSGDAEHYEILIRLLEEEEGMMPPGAFFPLAEKHGLMPHLDRWVVQHVAAWISQRPPAQDDDKRSLSFINLSAATIADPGFPEFLELTLLEHDIPGALLCFEIPNLELIQRPDKVAEFAQHIKRSGCQIAISGFGRDRIAFDMIRGFRVEYLKIDGGIVFNVLRDPVEFAKVASIVRVAGGVGVKTIAELVENDETIARLREVGVDFAQGFGISRPRPLTE